VEINVKYNFISSDASNESKKLIPVTMAAKFSMNLPAPVCSTPIPQSAGSKNVDIIPIPSFSNDHELDSEPSFQEATKSTDKEIEGKEQPPVAKKFKRRNASLYASNLEEDVS